MVSRAEYSDDYYNDFFDYTRAKLGDDRLIMSRPVDGLVTNSYTLSFANNVSLILQLSP